MRKTAIALALLLAPSTAFAQAAGTGQTLEGTGFGPEAGDWEVTLSGTGASDNDFDNTSLGVSGSVGKYLTDNVLGGVRQTVNFADVGDNDRFTGSTLGFAEYVFDLEQWRPYVGASLGGIYGEGVNNSFVAGPVVGVRYYATPTTFLYGQTEYLFAFQDADEVDDAFDDGGFAHALGIGFTF
jgi:hypothetical protein